MASEEVEAAAAHQHQQQQQQQQQQHEQQRADDDDDDDDSIIINEEEEEGETKMNKAPSSMENNDAGADEAEEATRPLPPPPLPLSSSSSRTADSQSASDNDDGSNGKGEETESTTIVPPPSSKGNPRSSTTTTTKAKTIAGTSTSTSTSMSMSMSMSGSMGSINTINAVRTSKLIRTLNKSSQKVTKAAAAAPDEAKLGKADKVKQQRASMDDNRKAALSSSSSSSSATSSFTTQRRTASARGFVPVEGADESLTTTTTMSPIDAKKNEKKGDVADAAGGRRYFWKRLAPIKGAAPAAERTSRYSDMNAIDTMQNEQWRSEWRGLHLPPSTSYAAIDHDNENGGKEKEERPRALLPMPEERKETTAAHAKKRADAAMMPQEKVVVPEAVVVAVAPKEEVTVAPPEVLPAYASGPSVPLYPLLFGIVLFYILKHYFFEKVFTYKNRVMLARSVKETLKLGGEEKQFYVSQGELMDQIKKLKKRRSAGSVNSKDNGSAASGEDKDGSSGHGREDGDSGGAGGNATGDSTSGGSDTNNGGSAGSNRSSDNGNGDGGGQRQSGTGKGNNNHGTSNANNNNNNLATMSESKSSFLQYMAYSEQLEAARQTIELLEADAVCSSERVEILREKLTKAKDSSLTLQEDKTSLLSAWENQRALYNEAIQQMAVFKEENTILKEKVRSLEEENEVLDEEMEHLVDEMEHFGDAVAVEKKGDEHEGEELVFAAENSTGSLLDSESLTADPAEECSIEDDSSDCEGESDESGSSSSGTEDDMMNVLRLDLRKAKADVARLTCERDEALQELTKAKTENRSLLQDQNLQKEKGSSPFGLPYHELTSHLTSSTTVEDTTAEMSLMSLSSNHTIESYEAMRAERDKLERTLVEIHDMLKAQGKNDSLMAENSDLKSQMEEVKVALASLTPEKDDLVSNLVKARECVARLEKERDEALVKLKVLEESVVELRGENESLKAQLDTSISEHDGLILQMEGVLNEMTNDTVDSSSLAKALSDGKISQLTAKVDTLTQERDKLLVKVKEADADLLEEVSKSNALEESVAGILGKNDRLSADLNSSKAKINDLGSQFKELNAKCVVIESEKEEYRKEMERVKGMCEENLADCESIIKQKTEEACLLNHALASSDFKHAKITAQVATLSQERDELLDKVKETIADLAREEAMSEGLEESADILQDENDLLSAELDSSKFKIDLLESQIKEIIGKNVTIEAERRERLDELEHIRGEHEMASSVLSDLKAKAHELNEAIVSSDAKNVQISEQVVERDTVSNAVVETDEELAEAEGVTSLQNQEDDDLIVDFNPDARHQLLQNSSFDEFVSFVKSKVVPGMAGDDGDCSDQFEVIATPEPCGSIQVSMKSDEDQAPQDRCSSTAKNIPVTPRVPEQREAGTIPGPEDELMSIQEDSNGDASSLIECVDNTEKTGANNADIIVDSSRLDTYADGDLQPESRENQVKKNVGQDEASPLPKKKRPSGLRRLWSKGNSDGKKASKRVLASMNK